MNCNRGIRKKINLKPFCNKICGIEEQYLLTEMIYEKNIALKLDAFRKLTGLLSDKEEPKEIYEFISNFHSEVPEENNTFLEILADFILLSSYQTKNRPSKILNNKNIMNKLIAFQKNPKTEYNSLLVFNILSYDASIINFDLSEILLNFNLQSDDKCSRLRSNILANAINQGYKMKITQFKKLQKFLSFNLTQEILFDSRTNDNNGRCPAEIIIDLIINDKIEELFAFSEEARMECTLDQIQEIVQILSQKFIGADENSLLAYCNILIAIVKQNTHASGIVLGSKLLKFLIELAEGETENSSYSALYLLNICIMNYRKERNLS